VCGNAKSCAAIGRRESWQIIVLSPSAGAFLAQALWQLADGDLRAAATSAVTAAWLLGADAEPPPVRWDRVGKKPAWLRAMERGR